MAGNVFSMFSPKYEGRSISSEVTKLVENEPRILEVSTVAEGRVRPQVSNVIYHYALELSPNISESELYSLSEEIEGWQNSFKHFDHSYVRFSLQLGDNSYGLNTDPARIKSNVTQFIQFKDTSEINFFEIKPRWQVRYDEVLLEDNQDELILHIADSDLSKNVDLIDYLVTEGTKDFHQIRVLKNEDPESPYEDCTGKDDSVNISFNDRDRLDRDSLSALLNLADNEFINYARFYENRLAYTFLPDVSQKDKDYFIKEYETYSFELNNTCFR